MPGVTAYHTNLIPNVFWQRASQHQKSSSSSLEIPSSWLYSITCLSYSFWNPKVAYGSLGSLSKGVSDRRTSTEDEAFLILKDLDETKFVSLLLKKPFTRKFKQDHFPRMQKVFFRLTCFAQKLLCWSSFLIASSNYTCLFYANVRLFEVSVERTLNIFQAGCIALWASPTSLMNESFQR